MSAPTVPKNYEFEQITLLPAEVTRIISEPQRAGYELRNWRAGRSQPGIARFGTSRVIPGVRLQTSRDVIARYTALHRKLVTFAHMTDGQWDQLDTDAMTKVAIARAAEFLHSLSAAALTGVIDASCAARTELLSQRNGGINLIFPLAWKEFDLSIEPDGTTELLVVDPHAPLSEGRYTEVGRIDPSALIKHLVQVAHS